MRLFKASLFLFSSLPLAFTDVTFSVPAAGASIPGGTAFTVTWTESNTPPLISALSVYDLVLYSGSNASPAPLTTLVAGGTFETNSVSVTVGLGIGGNTTNAYFLGMKSTATAGGYVINYSSRFTLTGMTGIFTDPVTTSLASVSGLAGPPTSNNVGAAAPAAVATTADAGAYGTPYNLQNGPIKYAPMQPQPPTSITAVNTSPLWPTSSVVIATTFLPIASVQTTITQTGAAATYASHANTAAAASQPTDDMQKFLNRWKD